MIQKQFYKTRKDGVNLYITFSDEGMMIEKKTISGRKEMYKNAVDVESANFEYVETDTPIKFSKQEKAIMAQTGRKYVLPGESLDLE